MKTNEKDTKQGIVPALRFPEFQNAGEWIKTPLSQIGEVLQGYGFPEKYQGKSFGKYPFYKVSDISKAVQTGCNFISAAANYIDDEELDILNIKTIPSGTTIFARIGEAIRLNRRIVTTQECIIDNNTVGVKAIPENAIDLFVYYILLQIDLIDFAGGVVPAVTKSAIENILIYCPPTKSEQQKIADCLSSIDALIKAAENKIDELKAHKKGLMQQLFPAEGKTVPALRFPEFQNAGEWEQTTIGAICTISNGKSNVQDNVQNGKYPLFDRSEIIKASNKFLFDCEAIIIPGEGRFIPKHYIGKFDLHQRAYALKDFTCHTLFVYHYITTFSFILTQKAVKSTVLSLRMPILEAFPLLLPNIQEQQKIADCLSYIDDLITAQTHRLEALRNHKKGLMQQLFPNLNDYEE